MKPDLIYLDHNATTPVHRRVFDEMAPLLTDKWGNPSSAHPIGWDAAEALSVARERVAALIGALPEEIVFTSGGTEANNLAILGTALDRPTAHACTTTIEHPATSEPLKTLEALGWEVSRIGVTAEGIVDSERFERAISERTSLLTVMHSNNETGAIQPIADLAALPRPSGAVFHADAAQSVGKVPIDVNELGVDLLSIAGHKLYAPKGVGALYIRTGVEISPVLRGAGQERGLKPGTENVAGAAALGMACHIARGDLEKESARIRDLRDLLLSLLTDHDPGVKLNGPPFERLPNTVNVRFEGVRGSLLLARCDEIAASTGSACHEGGDETPSGVLTAMGLGREEALGAVRLTLGRSTTEEDVRRAAAVLRRQYEALRN